MTDTIPYGRQNINEEDIQSVLRVLRSDWLTQGPAVLEFEKKMAEYCDVPYAVAVSNATAALHLTCLAMGLTEGDLLVTSPNSFVASANCALYCGAQVDFTDIHPQTYNLSVEELKKKLKIYKEKNKIPKIVVAVHFAGQSCEMKELQALSVEYGFQLIEDASHAVGGTYLEKKVGSCEFSDATIFSFHPVKIATTAEGGMVLTRHKNLYEKLKLLRTHGVTRNESEMHSPSHGPWYYEQIDLGFNYRLTDLQCALGISQLNRIDAFIKKRSELFHYYQEKLKPFHQLTLPYQHPNAQSAHHLFVVRLHLEKLKKSKKEIFIELRNRKIGVNVHYIPIHLQPYYQKMGFTNGGDFPEAEKYYEEAITLPLYYDLSFSQVDYIVGQLVEVLG